MNAPGGWMKPFSLEERKTIERLLKEGKTGGHIALILDRSKSGTNFEIRKHGGRYGYCAETATKLALQNQHGRIDKLRSRNTKRGPTLTHRIDALEMQIDILKETIKELIKND